MNYTRFTPEISGTKSDIQVSKRWKGATVRSTGMMAPRLDDTSAKKIPAETAGENVSSSTKFLIPTFLVCLSIPIFFDIGTLRLSPSRLFVLAAIVPLTFAWLSGKAGEKRYADTFVLLFGGWIVLSLSVTEGLPRFPYASMVAIETIAPYLLARVLIKSMEEYLILLKSILKIMAVLAPFAIYESIATIMPISAALDNFFSTFPKNLTYDLRLGLSRAQVVFEHPILFGIFSAMLLAPTIIYVRIAARSTLEKSFLILPILLCVFFSLSSGAYVSALIQFSVLVWGYLLRGYRKRWIALVSLVVTSMVAVDMASSRSFPEVLASYTSFSNHNAYMRIHQFNFGLESVANNPMFGLGFREWVRPNWLPRSVDNFWLVVAMKYGAPAFFLIAMSLIAVIITASSARPKSELAAKLRTAHIASLVATAVAIATVHLWSATYMMFMFVLGGIIWVASPSTAADKNESDP
jgi:hypothetical protein